MATLSSARYVRQQPGQPFKTLNVANTVRRTDKTPPQPPPPQTSPQPQPQPLLLSSSSSSSLLSCRPQCTAKRKSAVELLQETKSLYVKSETVLDRKQELRRSLRSSGSSDKGSSSHDVTTSGCYHYKGNCCNWSSSSITCLPPPKSPRLVASGCQRKSTADSQQLQNDLRRLLNADSKENLFEATAVFLDDAIVPPPAQYRRSASNGQHQQQQQQHGRNHPCDCGPSASCHKSLPDLSGVVTTAAAVTVDPSIRGRCRRSASSGSVVGDDGPDDDDDDDIFETMCVHSIPSPPGFGNKCKPDETDAAANVTGSFPDSLSLTSYKTDARWQQSAHGETAGSSAAETENERDRCGSVSPRSSASPVKSAVSCGRQRRRLHTTANGQPPPALPPPPPPPPPPRSPAVVAAAPVADDIRGGRPILRSKSDVGHRTPNLLSLLPATADEEESPANGRQEYDPEQLENFFGHLGLDPEEYRSIVKNDWTDAADVWLDDSGSSVGSVSGGGGGGGSGTNNNAEEPCAGGGFCGGTATACAGKPVGGGSSEQQLPSIVERNARIVKWLWNCRKAANSLQTSPPPLP